MTLHSVAHTDRTMEAATDGELTLVEREDCVDVTPLHRQLLAAIATQRMHGV
ncbi:hypothetical protein [Mycobacterium sp. URHB0021]